jgi:PPOX class probable F420-dependent enzyme
MAKIISKTNSKMIFENKYINLITFRESGVGVPTPVMYAKKNGKLYVETRNSRYKVNRIKKNPNVQIAPCNMRGQILGPSIEGTARILSKNEQNVAFEALRKKYFRFRLGDKIKFGKRGDDDRVYIEITPEFSIK